MRGRLHSSALGQVGEWLIWTQLVSVSDGDLHVFLPLQDRGIDAIVHRISTDQYVPVQVKVQSWRSDGRRGLELGVTPDELADDRAFLVATHVEIDDPALRDPVLVVPAPVFKAHAHVEQQAPGVVYRTWVGLPPRPESPWAPHCYAPGAIGDALAPAAAEPGEEGGRGMPVSTTPAWEQLGHRAEMELLRRAADCEAVNTFKAHPDLEPNEYLVYNLQTRSVTGIQVKAASLPAGKSEAPVDLLRRPLRPSPTTWFVIFLADEGSTEFLPDCAVIPSTVVAEHLVGEGDFGTLWVDRGITGRFARWRVPVAALGARLGQLGAR